MLDAAATEKAFATTVTAVRQRRDVVVVDGPDAAEYLQGQLSQDVAGLEVGSSAPTLLLQPQGKVDAWMRLTRVAPTAFWLDVDLGHGAQARDRLLRFKLRVDADVELVSMDMVTIVGPDAVPVHSVDPPDGGVAVDAHWLGADAVDLLGPAVAIPDGIDEGPVEALQVLRIRRGRPAMGAELDEDTIPAAAGIVEESVDFTKGCYVGQELVARIDSRGSNTPTRLQGLRFASPAGDAEAVDVTSIVAGADVRRGDEVIGRVTSTARSTEVGAIGLAYIKRAVELPATAEVSSSGSDQPWAVEVVELPLG